MHKKMCQALQGRLPQRRILPPPCGTLPVLLQVESGKGYNALLAFTKDLALAPVNSSSAYQLPALTGLSGHFGTIAFNMARRPAKL